MKFTIASEHLKASLKAMASVPEIKGPPPAVTISVDEFGGSYLQRNTHLATMRVSFDADIEEDGSCMVGFESLLARASRFPDEAQVLIQKSSRDSKITLKCGTSHANLAVFPEEPVREIPPIEGSPTPLDAQDFCEAIRYCLPAVHRGQGRENFVGPAFRTVMDQYALVSTDGRRVHSCFLGDAFEPVMIWKDDNGKDLTYDAGVMLEPNVSAPILAMLDGVKGEVKLTVAQTGASIECDGRWMRFCITSLSPNDLTMILREQTPKFEFRVDRKQLLQLVNAAFPVGLGDHHAITFAFEGNKLTVGAEDGHGNTFSDSIEFSPSVQFDKEKWIKCNAAYARDFLRALDDDVPTIGYLASYCGLVNRTERKVTIMLLLRDGIPEDKRV